MSDGADGLSIVVWGGVETGRAAWIDTRRVPSALCVTVTGSAIESAFSHASLLPRLSVPVNLKAAVCAFATTM